MVNNRNQNIYNKLNKPIINVVKPKRKTLKLNNNINNSPRTTTMQSMEYKVAFPPTHIRDWMNETKPALSPQAAELGWMGSNGNSERGSASRGPNSIAHSLEALPVDPLAPVPVPLKDLQPMNNNVANKGIKQNMIFAHNLRGLTPKRKTQTKVPWYAQTTAASRARVKATNVAGRQKAMAEHYRKIGSAPRKAGSQTLSGLTRRNKKSRKQK